jgi:putative effector of murein hydrolase
VVIAPAAIWVFGFPSAGFALFPVLASESIGISDVAVAAAAVALTAWSRSMSRPLVVRIRPRAALPIGMAIGMAGYVVGTVAHHNTGRPELNISSADQGLGFAACCSILVFAASRRDIVGA